MKAVTSKARFNGRERVRFLREIAKDLRAEEVQQAIAIVLRRDGAIGWVNLNPRGSTAELVGIFERAKLELFVDMRDRRRAQ